MLTLQCNKPIRGYMFVILLNDCSYATSELYHEYSFASREEALTFIKENEFLFSYYIPSIVELPIYQTP